MTTIYAFLNPNKAAKKGIVEMVNTYEGMYGFLAIDGQVIEEVCESDFASEASKRKFIKQCVKLSGVSEDKLTFIYCDFESYGERILNAKGEHLDGNSYNYEMVLDFFKNNNPPPKKDDYKIIAVGVEKLEEGWYS